MYGTVFARADGSAMRLSMRYWPGGVEPTPPPALYKPDDGSVAHHRYELWKPEVGPEVNPFQFEPTVSQRVARVGRDSNDVITRGGSWASPGHLWAFRTTNALPFWPPRR